MTTLYATVLEKPDDFGESPDLFVEETPDEATRTLIRTLTAYDRNLTGGLAAFCEDRGKWLGAHPVPAFDGDANLWLWLDGLHEWLGGFWWTRYVIDTDTLDVEEG